MKLFETNPNFEDSIMFTMSYWKSNKDEAFADRFENRISKVITSRGIFKRNAT